MLYLPCNKDGNTAVVHGPKAKGKHPSDWSIGLYQAGIL